MKIKSCFFNQCFNLYVEDEKLEPENWTKLNEEIIEIDNVGTLRLTKYTCQNLDFYTFGLLTYDKARRPGHGGEWSSNPAAIKEYFGIELLGVSLDHLSVHMEYDQIFKLYNSEVYKKDEDKYSTGLLSDVIEPTYNSWYDHNGVQLKKSQSL